ncbi:polysaccharide lyase 8 family protein [Streptosporangiaceae bacterium NEAU-GS5]|nr:polysaccharide lyase 8 family protein [Streptosporangiaceae bacterium NEAU-GS5]
MDDLLARWRGLLVGAGYDPAAAPYKGRLKAVGTRAGKLRTAMTVGPASSLWPDLPIGHDSGSITGSYHRLRDMALAYAMPGTGLTGDAGLADAVRAGLRHIHANAYNDAVARYANWWDWQIGAPQPLLDCCVLVEDDQLPDYLDAVDHFVPSSVVDEYSGVSTGANRVDLCRVLAVRGALGRSPDVVALAADALSPVFAYVTSGDGLYADGSFIQHRTVPYTGSYGVVLLDGLARMLTWLGGTPWEITDPQVANVFTSVDRAYAPFLLDGFMMDGQSGRAVSRGPDQNDHTRGVETIDAILLLAGPASAEQSARWRGLAKGWLRRGGRLPADVPGLARCRAVLDDATLAEVAEPTGSRVFAGMDRVLHRRPGWTLALAMCSSRIAYYETGNGENLRAWHSSAGMTYWWTSDDPYADGFWPTADPYRLPGTTVSRKPLPKAAGDTFGKICPPTPWAGGVTDGAAVVAAQRVRGLLSTLSARKSWFCLDDAVVCLGAEITSRDGRPVETSVEHRIVPDSARLTVDGAEVTDGSGLTAHWMAVEGVGGYLFPGGATVSTRGEDRTGTWQDINSARPATPVTRHYRTIWIDNTAVDSYAYVLLPGATADDTAARAADATWLTILANNAHQQAVQAGPVTGATFWTAGQAGPLTVDHPCCVLLRITGDTAVLSIADPARSGGVVELTWAHTAAAVHSKAKTITVVETSPAVRLRIAVGRRGATHAIKLTL